MLRRLGIVVHTQSVGLVEETFYSNFKSFFQLLWSFFRTELMYILN